MNQLDENQNKEVDTYLQGNSELSTLYAEMPAVDFPHHLDAAILAEAHRAVGSRPGAKPKRRWTIPLSMVATLFLAVMVGLQLPSMLKDSAQVPLLREERTMVAAMEKNIAEPLLEIEVAAKSISPAAPAASFGAESMDKQFAVKNELRRNESSLMVAPASVAPKRLQESEESAQRVTQSTEKKRAFGNLSDALEERAPAMKRMAVPAASQQGGGLIQDFDSKADSSDVNKSMEESLAHIKLLKQQGRLEEAKKELEAFKKRYPDYAVPQVLEVQ